MAAGVTDPPCLLNAIDGLNEHLDQNEVVLGKDVLFFPCQNPSCRLSVSEQILKTIEDQRLYSAHALGSEQ